MASLTKSELKEIVKECILEIFIEGIKAAQAQSPARKHLDNITFSNGAAKVADQAQGRRQPTQAVSSLAAEFPKEQRGIMQQIFEDTARNTLPSQIQAERSPGAASAVRADAISPATNVDPMSIFGGASNWADLAFAQAKK